MTDCKRAAQVVLVACERTSASGLDATTPLITTLVTEVVRIKQEVDRANVRAAEAERDTLLGRLEMMDREVAFVEEARERY